MNDKYKSAFPVHPEVSVVNDPQWCGMTLRDYFAAKAMQVLLAAGINSEQYEEDAMQAYEMADAMMEARNGQA